MLERHFNLRPRQVNLEHVLRRPVEVALTQNNLQRQEIGNNRVLLTFKQ